MPIAFRLPDLGEGVHEAEILAIHVVAGQAVKEGEPFIDVETDKAAVEIPAPRTGTIADIGIAKGDLAKVGDILCTFMDESAAPTADPGPTRPDLSRPDLPATKPAPGPLPAPPATPPSATLTSPQPVPASPATRRLARELGVELRLVKATGHGGVVTALDVRNWAALADRPATASDSPSQPPAVQPSPIAAEPSEPANPALPTAPPALATDRPEAGTPALPDFRQWGPIHREPFRSIRRATATQMATSWAQIPHVNCQDVVDITRLEEFRQRHKAEVEAAGGRLTMTVFAMKAVATALKHYPHFNASLDLASQEIIVKDYFHLGIAVDSDHGLMVPVISDVDRKSIKELAVELTGAILRVRQRRNSREEMQGGTFTITNVGGLGGSSFSAIINHPQVAILGLGQGRMQPAVVTSAVGEHQIVPRLMMPIVLCFDHRVVDGADAIRFLREIIDLLEDPDQLFIAMI